MLSPSELSIDMIDPGTHLTIHYPSTTHIRFFANAIRKPRSITVYRVRDLVKDPLSADEFLRRPFVMRSRWLVFAKEHAQDQWRQFYLGSSEEFSAPAQLRIGLYEPFSTKPIEILGREFNPTVFDRKLMMRMLRLWKAHETGDLQLKIYCDDLRLVK